MVAELDFMGSAAGLLEIAFGMGTILFIGILFLIAVAIMFVAWTRGYFGVKFLHPAIIFEEVGGSMVIRIDQARPVKKDAGKLMFQLKKFKEYTPPVDFNDLILTTDGKKALVLLRKNINEYYPYKAKKSGLEAIMSPDLMNAYVDTLKNTVLRFDQDNQWKQWIPVIMFGVFALAVIGIFWLLTDKVSGWLETTKMIMEYSVQNNVWLQQLAANLQTNATVPNPPF